MDAIRRATLKWTTKSPSSRILSKVISNTHQINHNSYAEDEEEQGMISADVSHDDLHRKNLDDLKFARATFPYGDLKELILALNDNRDAAPTLLDDTLISYQIVAAFQCAPVARDIDAVSPVIGQCAVLFRIEWSDNAEFIQNVSPFIVELLQCEHALLGEAWHDSLDTLCSVITSTKIADPEIIRCAIVSQTEFLVPDTDARFDDRIRAFKFLETMANHPMACFDDPQKEIFPAFAEQFP
jgi:hypothetical protein